MITSLVWRGARDLFAAFMMLAAASTAPPTSLASESGDRLPLMFDSRERLARPDLSTIVRLRILTTVDFPPFNFTDQTGRLSGFNVDLAREICAELKLEAKCQIQAIPFDELERTLEANGGEAVMAGIAVNPDRRERFLFSRSYIGIPARFAKSRSADIPGDTAAALAGRRVGVVEETAHEAMLKAFFPGIIAVPFETGEAMTAALKEKKIDAVFSDGLRLPFWVASDASEKCCMLFDGPYLSEKFLGEGLSVMVRRTDPLLVSAFDQALAELSRNGRLQDLYLRYFPNGLY
ncbi:amino acid ABC transporter [Rhizobium wenxiniae]|uniref:Polar amino acid transport system substrate-binding protein n=1 Tax=Rhizobium wenxiniae TaxID=1737357 RepID=A0A7X0D0U2_9HYPH|nr:polar amino acid transport system substrate-binding protein [Rhizobium wenxiniae]GGF95287.1 amino acid ABC transporter [Rhizobium wenxiniae]